MASPKNQRLVTFPSHLAGLSSTGPLARSSYSKACGFAGFPGSELSDLPKPILMKSCAPLQNFKRSTCPYGAKAELINACKGLQTLHVYIQENTVRTIWALEAKRPSGLQLAWVFIITCFQGQILQGCPCKLVTLVSRVGMDNCGSSRK